MKQNKFNDKIRHEIKNLNLKENFLAIFIPKKKYDECSERIFHQMEIYRNFETIIGMLFIFGAAVSYYSFDETFRNYPVIGIFLFALMLYFLLFTKKLFVKTEKDNKEWFKEPYFQDVAVHYFTTRKYFKGEIFFFIFLLFLAFITTVFVDTAINYNKEYPENVIDVFLDISNQTTFENDEIANMIKDLVFVFPWLPLIFLFSMIIFKIKLKIDRGIVYYFAYATIKTLNECEKSKDSVRFNLFRIGLELYDEFLRSTIKLTLDNIDKIYSKVIGNPQTSQNEIYGKLLEKFDDVDSFKPLKYLSEIVGEDITLVKRKIMSERARFLVTIALSAIIGSINIIRWVFPELGGG